MKLQNFTDFIGLTNSTLVEKTPDLSKFDPSTLGIKTTLLSWTSDSRTPVMSLSGRFSRPFIVIGVVIALFFMLMQEFILLAFFGAIYFFVHVLNKVKPSKVHYELSTYGLNCAGKLYYWPELKEYYFTKREDVEFLILNTWLPLPARLFVIINSEDKEKVQAIVGERLNMLEEEPKTIFDTIFKSLVDRLDIEEKKR